MIESKPAHQQKTIATSGGWERLALNLAVLLGGAVAVFLAILAGVKDFWPDAFSILLMVAGILMMISGVVLLCGHFTLQPNEASVLILFGAYKGTEIRSGFHWANPLYTKKKVSLRSRNLDGGKLKVNDKRGNPIEIAAVVVWRVDVVYLTKDDWKYEGSTAGSGGGGRTHTFGVVKPARLLKNKAVYARADVKLSGGKPVPA